MRVCHSPELFAAYRGLPRLRVPRHPPHAFIRLTTMIPVASRARAIFQTSDNLAIVSQFRFAIPRSTTTSVVKQRRQAPRDCVAALTNRNGNGYVEACDHTGSFPRHSMLPRALTRQFR